MHSETVKVFPTNLVILACINSRLGCFGLNVDGVCDYMFLRAVTNPPESLIAHFYHHFKF